MREMKGKAGIIGIKMYAGRRKWVLNLVLFGDDTALIAENENDRKFGQCF